MTQAGSVSHNLPVEATSFVGRAFALTEVHRLLAETRLLTLTGPGGCGKSRLALRAAARSLACFPDGVWLADLATVSQPDLLPLVVAAALGISEQSGLEPIQVLARGIGSRRALLVLDNCEHLIDDGARLAELLLTNSTELHILATSREALRSPGETVWSVPPLALPSSLFPLPLPLLEQVDAVQLFVDRARARQPGFQLTAERARAVVEVCRRLDGLPLAIELAAAQTGALTVEQIAAHLDDMLSLLAGGRRSLARQETIRATIDWSHASLTEPERLLFRRLAVFTGGFDLAAVEAVCAGTPTESALVLPTLIRLVEKSLVLAETLDSESANVESVRMEARYRLLEPVRQYAREFLDNAGELAGVEQRHARHFLALVETAEPGLRSAERPIWLERLAADRDNFRAAFAWALGDAHEGDAEIALRLAGALYWFWFWDGQLTEGTQWAERALRMGGDAFPAARARALHSAGALAWSLGDLPIALARLEESVALSRQVGDEVGLAHALPFLAVAASDSGRPAVHLAAEAVDLFRALGDRWGVGYALQLTGVSALERGDYAEASASLEQCLVHFREVGDTLHIAETLFLLGDIARAQERDAAASAFYAEGRRLYEAEGIQLRLPSLLHNLGYLALREGDPKRAHDLFQESLRLFVRRGDQRGIAECVAGIAAARGARGQPEEAARLFGAAQTLFRISGTVMWRANELDHERNLQRVRIQLGADQFDGSFERGRAMRAEEALALAARGTAEAEALPSSAGSSSGDELHRLSQREQEVAALVACGLTSRQIGERLFITEGTAALHVKHILAKLGFTSRAQVAAWAVEQRLATLRTRDPSV